MHEQHKSDCLHDHEGEAHARTARKWMTNDIATQESHHKLRSIAKRQKALDRHQWNDYITYSFPVIHLVRPEMGYSSNDLFFSDEYTAWAGD
jgi:hypothetical protein